MIVPSGYALGFIASLRQNITGFMSLLITRDTAKILVTLRGKAELCLNHTVRPCQRVTTSLLFGWEQS